jgi:hypothetical protein
MRTRRTTAWAVAGTAVLLLLVSGCAAAANPSVTHGSGVPGFWLGLWQGLILPVTFVISLFDEDVGVYAVKNSGHLYDLGFVLGAGGLSAPGFLSRNRTGRSS